MYTYTACWMGPVNYKWVQKNGEHWAGGRINVYDKTKMNRREISLPTMHKQDYNQFSEWLEKFTSVNVLTLLELVALFEKETNINIRWFDLEKSPGNEFI
jgi:hypothetical protein